MSGVPLHVEQPYAASLSCAIVCASPLFALCSHFFQTPACSLFHSLDENSPLSSIYSRPRLGSTLRNPMNPCLYTTATSSAHFRCTRCVKSFIMVFYQFQPNLTQPVRYKSAHVNHIRRIAPPSFYRYWPVAALANSPLFRRFIPTRTPVHSLRLWLLGGTHTRQVATSKRPPWSCLDEEGRKAIVLGARWKTCGTRVGDSVC